MEEKSLAVFDQYRKTNLAQNRVDNFKTQKMRIHLISTYKPKLHLAYILRLKIELHQSRILFLQHLLNLRS